MTPSQDRGTKSWIAHPAQRSIQLTTLIIISDATSLRVIDYRGYTLKYLDRYYQPLVTLMDSVIYEVARYNTGRNKATVCSYCLAGSE